MGSVLKEINLMSGCLTPLWLTVLKGLNKGPYWLDSDKAFQSR